MILTSLNSLLEVGVLLLALNVNLDKGLSVSHFFEFKLIIINQVYRDPLN